MNYLFASLAALAAAVAVLAVLTPVFHPAIPACDSCTWAARDVAFDVKPRPYAESGLSRVYYAQIYVDGKPLTNRTYCKRAWAVVVGGVAYVSCKGAPVVPLSVAKAGGSVQNLCFSFSVSNAVFVSGSDNRDLRGQGIWAKVVDLKKNYWDRGYASVTLSPNGVAQFTFTPIPDAVMDYAVFWEDCTSCDSWPSAAAYTDEVLRVVVFKNMTIAILLVQSGGAFQHNAVINGVDMVIKPYNTGYTNRWINTGVTLDPAEPFTFAIYALDGSGTQTHYTTFAVSLKECQT
jgi:hypothetical protein